MTPSTPFPSSPVPAHAGHPPGVEVDRSERYPVVRVFGGLEGLVASALTLCVGGLAAGGSVHLVVDLDEVPYCDAAGLGTLLGIHQRLDDDGGRLEVRQAAPDVRHVLEERGLDQVFHLH